MSGDQRSQAGALFFCVGSNHRTADVATRERFYLTPEQAQKSMSAIVSSNLAVEAAILSTCNRFEIYGVLPDHSIRSTELLETIFLTAHQEHKPSEAARAAGTSLYTLMGEDAIRHAFRVASSLDSLIPGETQITGQFKEAVALSREAKTLGPLLGRLTQEILATVKKIRTQTDIGKHRVSISHAAIDLAKRASNDLSTLSFLIVGSGEMARVAAEYAAGYKPKSLLIANRTRHKAFELTEHIGYGEAHGLDNLYNLISKSDVVISATSANGYVINAPELKAAVAAKKHGPLFLIDIALPRDIDPKAGDIDDVYLFDIDDLKSVVDAHMGKRKEAIDQASDLAREGVSGFLQWMSHHEVAPTLNLSSTYFKHLFQRESSKTFSRDIFADLTPRQKEAIQALQDSVCAKITGDIAQALRGMSPDSARSTAEMLDFIFQERLRP